MVCSDPVFATCGPETLPAAKESRLNRLFRQPERGAMGYAALAIFALAYLCAMALVLAPGQMLPNPTAAVAAETEN